MCGIYGILSLEGHLDREAFGVPNGNEVLRHRGPDAHGHFIDNSIYLGHRRLSIIDLEGGDQPIFNEDKTKCVVFNGEIYNYREIRKELMKQGHMFRTNSDTEVIIHSYEEWSESCVDKFRGMFAFAIWDSHKKVLFIARDRVGEKPLFYAQLGDTFFFGSEIKSILQFPYFPRTIDPDGLACYFTLSYIPSPLTIYKHILKLEPGHTLTVSNDRIKISKYWDLFFETNRSKNEKYFIDGFMGLMEESVGLRMISDVPIGAFLSGGIDSGTVVALMSRLTPDPIHTFCMGFGGNTGGYLDETNFARQVAEKFRTNHRENIVYPNVREILKDIVLSFDEPFADHSTIPSYYLCKITREHVKVALSGLGGDELFGGYERYLGFKFSSWYNLLPLALRERIIRPIAEKIPERTDGHYTVNHIKRFMRSSSLPQDKRYYGFLTMLNNDTACSLFAEPEKYKSSFEKCLELVLGFFNSDNAKDPLDKAIYVDLKTYLPEDILACTDRTSMWHSLEVRVPFLDHRLMEFCATIPSEMKIRFWEKKHLLKKAVKGMLPRQVLNHRKQGFVGPMTQWLKTDLRSYVEECLSEGNLKKSGIFDHKAVRTLLDEHFNQREINDKLIWSLVVFQTWLDLYINSNEVVRSGMTPVQEPFPPTGGTRIL